MSALTATIGETLRQREQGRALQRALEAAHAASQDLGAALDAMLLAEASGWRSDSTRVQLHSVLAGLDALLAGLRRQRASLPDWR